MQRCRFVGLPGSGKTYRAIEIIAKVKERGFGLEQIGYSTFTRAARREASERASETFGVSIEDLERRGWFRTIHSSVMRCLGVPRGSIVNYDQAWLADALQDPDLQINANEDDEDAWVSQWKGRSPVAAALALWDVARSRLLPFQTVYDQARRLSGGPPAGLGDAEGESLIERYEMAKARDCRIDFTDALLAYAGRRMTLAGPETIEPRGMVPGLAVQILDEAQDQSPLLDLAARRLSSSALWYYLFGDPLQGIYGFSGADPRAFMKWEVAHQEYLNKSYRCARRIMEAGLDLIYKNDEFTSEIKKMAVEPRCEGGKIESDTVDNLDYHIQDLSITTLVMARTNYRAATLQNLLTAAGIPWKNTRTPARWPPLASTSICEAFTELEQGGMIDGEAWRRIVQTVPADILVRGTKTRFKSAAEAKEQADFVTLLGLHDYGGTDALKEYIGDGRWLEIVGPEAKAAHDAKKKWGDLAVNPKVQVGTVHSTKGMEAQKVLLSTGIDGPVLRSLRTEEGQEEERRVWYVGLTRARDHLVLLRDKGKNYQDVLDVSNGA